MVVVSETFAPPSLIHTLIWLIWIHIFLIFSPRFAMVGYNTIKYSGTEMILVRVRLCTFVSLTDSLGSLTDSLQGFFPVIILRRREIEASLRNVAIKIK